jgi:hypothetical protein
MTTGWEAIPAAQGDRNMIRSPGASTGHPGQAPGAVAPVTRPRSPGMSPPVRPPVITATTRQHQERSALTIYRRRDIRSLA